MFHKDNILMKRIVLGLFTLICYFNFSYFLKYYKSFNENSFSIEPSFVSVKLQEKIAHYIVNDSKNENYSLIRVGPNDRFEEYYSQNYKYLLWLYGNEPIENSSLSYTIYENIGKPSDEDVAKIHFVGPIGIVKNEK